MYEPTPKISWISRTPGPLPFGGTHTLRVISPPSTATCSVRVGSLMSRRSEHHQPLLLAGRAEHDVAAPGLGHRRGRLLRVHVTGVQHRVVGHLGQPLG